MHATFCNFSTAVLRRPHRPDKEQGQVRDLRGQVGRPDPQGLGDWGEARDAGHRHEDLLQEPGRQHGGHRDGEPPGLNYVI